MNQKEQIEKMAGILNKDLGVGASAEIFAKALINRGYINGADFVAHLQIAEIKDKEYPHLATALCFDETREELTDFINKALQEYLKGE